MTFFKYFVAAICSAVALSLLFLLYSNDKIVSKEEVPLIPRKYLFGNPEKTSAKIAKDGTKIAYLAPDSNNVLNVWIRDLNHEGKDQQITQDQKRGVRQFAWQLDQKHILYVQDTDGDENWHLYQTDIETKETKDLTPYKNIQVQILDADYHFPDILLIQMNLRDSKDFDVYRVDLKTGKMELDTENPGGYFNWVADHNLQVKIAQSYTEDGSTLIHVRNNSQSPWKEWMSFAPTEIGEVLGFSEDNQSIYLLSSIDSNTARLLKINLESKESSLIAHDPDYDLSGIMQNPTSYKLEAVEVEREKLDRIIIDPTLETDFVFIKQQLKQPISLVSRDLANQTWIVVTRSDASPSQFFLYHRPSKDLKFLFSVQPALEQYPLSPMNPIQFKARDGMLLHGYLTLPLNKEPINLPTVLVVHGGPWARDSWGLNPMVQWLANRGYAVLQINFRGSTGYGKNYLNAGNREWADKMRTDLLDGKQWLVGQKIADPQKVAIFGGSYGGYATLAGLTFTPDAFCCGVDIVGPSNLITLLQTIPPYWSSFKAIMNLRLGNLDKDAEFLKASSPLFKADRIIRPLLIGQGAHDPRVKQAESDQIVTAMREKGIPVEYLLFPDEGHGFARPENRLKFYSATEAFLSKYLGGRAEPASAEENWENLKN